MANYPAKMIFGTAQTVISTATDIANGNYSGAPTEFNNTNDAAVPYADRALCVLQCPDWAAAPTAGSVVSLWMIRKNVDGTADDTGAPSGATQNGAEYCGSFLLYATDELQRRSIVIDISGVIGADFYIYNGSGQNMNNDGGTSCVLKVTPFTLGITV